MVDSDMKIIGGESFSEFCRRADNNMHRTSKASPESGEYFYENLNANGRLKPRYAKTSD